MRVQWLWSRVYFPVNFYAIFNPCNFPFDLSSLKSNCTPWPRNFLSFPKKNILTHFLELNRRVNWSCSFRRFFSIFDRFLASLTQRASISSRGHNGVFWLHSFLLSGSRKGGKFPATIHPKRREWKKTSTDQGPISTVTDSELNLTILCQPWALLQKQCRKMTLTAKSALILTEF